MAEQCFVELPFRLWLFGFGQSILQMHAFHNIVRNRRVRQERTTIPGILKLRSGTTRTHVGGYGGHFARGWSTPRSRSSWSSEAGRGRPPAAALGQGRWEVDPPIAATPDSRVGFCQNAFPVGARRPSMRQQLASRKGVNPPCSHSMIFRGAEGSPPPRQQPLHFVANGGGFNPAAAVAFRGLAGGLTPLRPTPPRRSRGRVGATAKL